MRNILKLNGLIILRKYDSECVRFIVDKHNKVYKFRDYVIFSGIVYLVYVDESDKYRCNGFGGGPDILIEIDDEFVIADYIIWEKE